MREHSSRINFAISVKPPHQGIPARPIAKHTGEMGRWHIPVTPESSPEADLREGWSSYCSSALLIASICDHEWVTDTSTCR